MKWEDIESAGREKYNLLEEWHLCAADAGDPEVIKVEFGRKGPRGGWLRGKEHSVKGFLIKANI